MRVSLLSTNLRSIPASDVGGGQETPSRNLARCGAHHRKPIRGDHGVRFELRSDLDDPQAVLALIASELPVRDETGESRQTA